MKNPPTEVETEVQGFDPDLLSVLHVVVIYGFYSFHVVCCPQTWGPGGLCQRSHRKETQWENWKQNSPTVNHAYFVILDH